MTADVTTPLTRTCWWISEGRHGGWMANEAAVAKQCREEGAAVTRMVALSENDYAALRARALLARDEGGTA